MKGRNKIRDEKTTAVGRNCGFFHAGTIAEKLYMGLFRQGGINCVK